MPKVKSSTIYEWRLRVDLPAERDENDMKMFLEQNCSVFLLVHHTTTTENPHYHAYCATNLSQGNFSNKLKKALNVKGGNYSCAKCDPDRKLGYLSYLFNTKKGNIPRCVSYDGMSPIDVATAQASAKEIADSFETKCKAIKKTQIDVAHIVLERIQEHKESFLSRNIYDHAIAVLKECRMMIRPHQVRDIIFMVMALSGHPLTEQTARDKVCEYFSRE